MKREVKYEEKLGVFSISCQNCPFIPMYEAMGEKPKGCVTGMVTNMQVHVPVHACKQYQKDSISNGDGNTLWIECKEETP